MILKKKIAFILLFMLSVSIFGCRSSDNGASSNSFKTNGNINRVEIYSANDKVLLGTFEKKEIISYFDEKLEIEPLELSTKEIATFNAKHSPIYNIEVYKKSVSLNSTDDTHIYTLTTYENTNIIKMSVDSESIPSFSVPKELLAFYYTATQKTIDNINSIMEHDKNSVSGKVVE